MKKFYSAFLAISFILILSASSQTANWSAVLPALFPTNVSGQIHGISRVSQLKFHPTNSNKMYAVSARGGLFVTTNGGTSWSLTPGTDNLPYSAFASVCIDHTDDQILYLGAGDHNYYYDWGGATGVWKTTNGGTTYTQTSLNNKIIVDMIMDPSDHNVVIAVTNGGIYKTTNGGSTWTLKTASIAFDDLKQRTPVSRVLFAATRASEFYRSTDFGNTWTQITAGIVLPGGVTSGNGCRVAVTPADTNIVYLGMVANGGLLYKSTDGGINFTAIKTTPPPYLTYYNDVSTSSGQGDYNFGIGVDRVNANIIYLVAHNVWKSTDGGVTWTQLTNWWAKVHTDMHQIITSPYNNSQVWNVNDGGVWLSTDGGNNWVPKSDGIYGYEIYHGNCSPTRRDMFSIGTQDNGELYATTAGWFTNRGGDWGSKCSFDYRANSSMVYYHENNKRRLVTGGDQTYGLPSSVTILQDIAFNRSNSNLAFVGDTVILRTTDLNVTTPTWTQIANLNKKIMAMHSSYADANRLYVITSDGFIYVSTNALSASPSFTSYTLPNSTNNEASITSIKSSPNKIYITCNTKVYRSIDSGATWTNITYNLPSVNHVRILADEYYSTNELVLVATNNAVYYKVANAASWTLYNTGLPSRTSIVDMSFYNDSSVNSVLRVATYGRGMWETPISNLRDLNANFSADDTNPCQSASVQFSDLSTGYITSYSWSFPGGTPSTSIVSNPSVLYSSSGTYSVTLTISNGTSTNSITKTNYILVNGANLPLSEGFETTNDPPTGWLNIDNGTLNYKWAKTSAAGGFGTSINSMMFDNYGWNVPGEKDQLQIFRLDFTGYNSVQLTFDLAYQVFTGYSDTLGVRVSTDCGNTFTTIWSKGGGTLSTAGSGGNNFIPTAGQWRTETLDLSSYFGMSGVILEFQNTNGYGNKLYIDNVNINAIVAANAGIDKTICAGGSTTIGVSPVANVNYSWLPTTGLSSSTVSNPVATPSGTTSYTLTATQAFSGIQNKDTVIVNVTPNVSVGVIISASPSGAICSGTNVTFTATPTNGGTPTYQWKKNGTNVGTNSSTYSNNTLVTGDIILCVMSSSLTCITSNPVSSNAITMTVNPNVGASVSISANPAGTICQGTNVIFTAIPVNGGTPIYQWKKNGTNVGTNSSTYSNNALLNNDVISCSMTSNASCVTGSPASSNNITMSVSTPLPVSISITSNPAGAICQGANVTYTAAPVNGGTATYQWKRNGVNVGTNSASYSTSSLSNGDAVNCVMTSSLSCVSGSPATSNTITKTVTDPPVVNSFSPSSGIIGTSVVITGLNFLSVSSVKFNGVSAVSYSINSSTQITATVPAGSSSGNISVVATCGTGTSVSAFIVVPAAISINLQLFIQGYYLGSGLMTSTLGSTNCDSITLELHQSVSPYSFFAGYKAIINTSGNGTFTFSNSFFGNSYYLVVKHRNALETWSAAPVLLNANSISYDFSLSASSAFGNNLTNFIDGKCGLWSGDVDQNGIIDNTDYLSVENKAIVFYSGYVVQDITGNNIVESSDYSLLENNIGIGKFRP